MSAWESTFQNHAVIMPEWESTFQNYAVIMPDWFLESSRLNFFLKRLQNGLTIFGLWDNPMLTPLRVYQKKKSFALSKKGIVTITGFVRPFGLGHFWSSHLSKENHQQDFIPKVTQLSRNDLKLSVSLPCEVKWSVPTFLPLAASMVPFETFHESYVNVDV